jgi:arginase
MGPSAVRVAGLNHALTALGHEVSDGGNIPVRLPEQQHFGDPHAKYLKEIAETSREVANRIWQTLSEGFFPVTLGGDHSMAIGTQAGVAKFYKDCGQTVGCLWIDAHADMNTPETSPSGSIHGMPFAASLGHGPESLTEIFGFAPKLRAENCALIGIRDLDVRERQMVRDSRVSLFTMREIDELGMRIVMERAIGVASKGTAGFVVSFDMDVLDPSEAPGVGTPVRGGITFREAHLAMEMVADSGKMLAFELVEINPIIDVMNKTATLGVGFTASALGKRIL